MSAHDHSPFDAFNFWEGNIDHKDRWKSFFGAYTCCKEIASTITHLCANFKEEVEEIALQRIHVPAELVHRSKKLELFRRLLKDLLKEIFKMGVDYICYRCCWEISCQEYIFRHIFFACPTRLPVSNWRKVNQLIWTSVALKKFFGIAVKMDQRSDFDSTIHVYEKIDFDPEKIDRALDLFRHFYAISHEFLSYVVTKESLGTMEQNLQTLPPAHFVLEETCAEFDLRPPAGVVPDLLELRAEGKVSETDPFWDKKYTDRVWKLVQYKTLCNEFVSLPREIDSAVSEILREHCNPGQDMVAASPLRLLVQWNRETNLLVKWDGTKRSVEEHQRHLLIDRIDFWFGPEKCDQQFRRCKAEWNKIVKQLLDNRYLPIAVATGWALMASESL